jgi:rod shape-determining protein MreD
MKKIIFIGCILAAALVQTTLIGHVRIFGVKPDLFWIMILSAGLYFDAGTAVVLSLICGLLKDCLGSSSFGAYTLLLPIWSLIISNASKRISFDHTAVSVIFLSVMIFVNAVVLRCLPFVPYGPLSFIAFMRVSILEAFYTAAFFILLGPAMRRVALSTLW